MTGLLRAIPTGWRRVVVGEAAPGDKFWSLKLSAWLPVTHNDWAGEDVRDETVPTIIRKNGD